MSWLLCIRLNDSLAYEWLFLKVEHGQYTIDNRCYQLDRLPELLGVFQQILDFYQELLADVPI